MYSFEDFFQLNLLFLIKIKRVILVKCCSVHLQFETTVEFVCAYKWVYHHIFDFLVMQNEHKNQPLPYLIDRKWIITGSNMNAFCLLFSWRQLKVHSLLYLMFGLMFCLSFGALFNVHADTKLHINPFPNNYKFSQWIICLFMKRQSEKLNSYSNFLRWRRCYVITYFQTKEIIH